MPVLYLRDVPEKLKKDVKNYSVNNDLLMHEAATKILQAGLNVLELGEKTGWNKKKDTSRQGIS